MAIVYWFLISQVLLKALAILLYSRALAHPPTVILVSLLGKTMIWRRRNEGRLKFQWTNTHLSTLDDYFTNLHLSCDFTNMRCAKIFVVFFNYRGLGSSRIHAKIVSYFTQGLHPFFRVPKLLKILEEENRIKKHQLVKVFLSFLVELLYHSKTEEFDPYKYLIDKLEKELRFLLTVLGDESVMLHEEEFQNYLEAGFEEVANEAGSFIHSLLFSTNDRLPEKMDVVVNHINLLKANIMRFLNHLPCVSKPPCTTMVDSLILNSVIHDLEDLIFREDDSIADVKDHFKILHRGLTYLQSFINNVGLQRSSEIGILAHQTEYLIISFLSGEAPLWYVINRLTYINHKIELIATDLQEIAEKHELGDVKAAKHVNTLGKFEVDDVVVGFEDRETDVLEYLVGRGKSLQVISISGMPGIGKTTLAKILFNHPTVNTWFEILSWCVVCQTYESENILAEILTQINSEFDKDSASIMDSGSLVVQIHKTLYGRRYLIVMDDVWDSKLWDDLVGCFPDDGNGSRILFTTRNKDVGPSNCDNYALPSLSNEECWELLEKKVFGNNTCPPQLIGIGKRIAANCWGLTLTVIVIAGILSTMDKEKHMWEKVRGNLASHVFDGTGDNSVMQILELSYKHLPERLKPCFLYLRAFARHKEVPVGKLTMLWISEGFIHNEQGKSAEDVAEEYLRELIDKSLVMVAKRRSDGRVKTCVLHDLLRGLCSKICEDEKFLKIEESSIYSVYENGVLHLVDPRFGTCSRSYCQQVRSVRGSLISSPFYPGRMRLLRVSDFSYLSDHLTGVEYLVNLRYLVVKDLPASVGSLVNLEYLRVETQEAVRLPPVILRMIKLRHLNVYCGVYDEYRNSFQTNNLESFSCILITNEEDEEMLKCSPNLHKLKCVYKRGRPSLNFDIRFLSRLHSLKIILTGSGVTKIRNIKKLCLYGMVSFPWEKMSTIGRLEKLEVLKLKIIKSSEEERWDGEVRWETQDGEFQKLKLLKLDRLVNLIEWNVESSGHFPVLERLVIVDCENLKEIPSEIGEITTLQLIEVKGRCGESLVESAKLIQQQQLDMENEELKVVITNIDYVRII